MIYICNALYDYFYPFHSSVRKKKLPTTCTHKHTVVLEHEIDFERSYALFAFHLGLCDKTLFFKNRDR